MNKRNEVIQKYSMNGYKCVDRAEAYVLKEFVQQGIKKYSSKMEKNICKNCLHYTDNDNDIVFYNELKNKVIIANAIIEKRLIVGYKIWVLK